MERRTIDVQVIFRKHLWTLVNRGARTVKNASQHVLRDRKLHARPSEFYMRGLDIDAGCPLKHLHDGLFALNLENLTAASRSIRKRKGHDFVVRGELESIQVQFEDPSSAG